MLRRDLRVLAAEKGVPWDVREEGRAGPPLPLVGGKLAALRGRGDTHPGDLGAQTTVSLMRCEQGSH